MSGIALAVGWVALAAFGILGVAALLALASFLLMREADALKESWGIRSDLEEWRNFGSFAEFHNAKRDLRIALRETVRR